MDLRHKLSDLPTRACLTMICLFSWTAGAAAGDQPQSKQGRNLLLFGADFDLSRIETTDAEVSLVAEGGLSVRTGHEKRWPGIALSPPAGSWDLSRYASVTTEVTNRGKEPVAVYCRVDNPGADGRKHCVTRKRDLEPGERRRLVVRVHTTPWRLSKPIELIGMRARPEHTGELDPRNVTRILFFVSEPRVNHAFEIGPLRATGAVEELESEGFLPFIDEFGQFIHSDWPGKTHSTAELMTRREAEEKELTAQPGPENRTPFGGWRKGPKLEASGFFRVEKHAGKWWLVDPEGRLFWSHGVDCVRSSSATPISHREDYFRGLPPKDSPLADCYGTGSWAPHGYYTKHTPYRSYDFARANLECKYGEKWQELAAETDHRRLRSWGLNTVANWSDRRIYLLRHTPYVTTIDFRSKPLEGSEGYWREFPDVFDPSFRAALGKRLLTEKGVTAGDPWCLGYFVHNELGWGDELSLALAALASPPGQAAKKVFVADLKAKYGSIEQLNDVWGTEHPSWDALRESRDRPDRLRARADLELFYVKTAETYFETIRDELKKVAPKQLYLGCRFAWVNDSAARAAAKYCDVISYNRYSYEVESLRLPDQLDRPVIIGEFHFGALDRGLFHTGLRAVETQAERAEAYRNYVRGALGNPLIVGTHWFQYRDQATTGRGDGENYQIGLVDICDTPYRETIAACRDVGYTLYEYRLRQP